MTNNFGFLLARSGKMRYFITTIIVFSTCFYGMLIEFTVATILVTFDDIVKSPSDRRSYRGLILGNCMKVLLISDREASKSGAAMSVGVGSLDDTLDVPGLASLMAIVLMKGTTDFGEFLDRNHGNLYSPIVEAREQIFCFDVRNARLNIALEKFVEFFTKPMLTSAAVLDDAIEDIEDECKIRRTDDTHRIAEVEKSMCRRNAMYNHFYLGTKELFFKHAKKAPRRSLIQKMEKFHDMWYSSNLMRLVVLGQENLDTLQEMVAPIFNNVVNKAIVPLTFEFRHHPCGPESLGHKIYVESISKDMNVLRLSFPVPDDPTSSAYIIYFLTHGVEGSLIFLLRRKNLCINLDVELVSNGGISFFVAKFDLHPDISVPYDVDFIIYLTFQYLNLLHPNDLPEWLYEENWRTYLLGYFNLVFDDEPISAVLRSFASEMQVHPLSEILMREYIHDHWNPMDIKYFLECLKPEKMNATIISPKFANVELDLEEPYLGTKYEIEKLSDEFIQFCKTREAIPGLQFPKRNKLLPKDFTIYAVENEKIERPYKLHESPKYEIWFLQQQKFNKPSLSIEFQLFSAAVRYGPFGSAFWSILTNLMNRTIHRNLGYPLSKAHTDLTLEFRDAEMHVKLYGYSDTLSAVLEKVLSIVLSFRDNGDTLDWSRFELIREEYVHAAKVLARKNHASQTERYVKLVQETDSWPEDVIENVSSSLDFDHFKKFLSKVFRRIFVRGLIHGNYTEKKALEIVKIFEKSFRSSSGMLLQEVMLQPRITEISDGSHFVLRGLNRMKTFGYSALFQLHTKHTTLENVSALLLTEIIIHECHSILRPTLDKKESSDHITYSCYLVETSGVHGIMITLSSEENPRVMDKRLEAFLLNIHEMLRWMPDTRLEVYKNSLQQRKYPNPLHQRDLSDLYWLEIESRRYTFNKNEDESNQLLALKPVQLVRYFQEMLDVKSPRRRKLATHIFPTTIRAENNNVSTFMDRFLPPGVS